MKNIGLLTFALFIDGLQAATVWLFFTLGLGLQIATPIGGAAAGAIYCFSANTGDVIEKIFSAGECAAAGGILGAIGMPLGIGLGIVATICLSATFGAALILLLKFNGVLYPKYLIPGAIAEIIPMFGALPTWTGITAASLFKKYKDDKIKATKAALLGTPSSPRNQEVPVAVPQPRNSMDGVIAPYRPEPVAN